MPVPSVLGSGLKLQGGRIAPVLVKNHIFVCYSVMGPMNASPNGYLSQIQGHITQEAAAKAKVQDFTQALSKEILMT